MEFKLYLSKKWEYFGQRLNGHRHGFGKGFYSTGELYIGHWKKGRKHGKGTVFFGRGEHFTGEWDNDVINGHGFLSTDSDTVYEGHYTQSKNSGIVRAASVEETSDPNYSTYIENNSLLNLHSPEEPFLRLRKKSEGKPLSELKEDSNEATPEQSLQNFLWSNTSTTKIEGGESCWNRIFNHSQRSKVLYQDPYGDNCEERK